VASSRLLTFGCSALPRFAAEEEAMAAQREFQTADIYAGRRNGNLQLGQLGTLKTASREVLRAQLTGTEVDHAKVGAPGDVLVGAAKIVSYLNSLCFSQS